MRATIETKTKDLAIINWSGPTGFGQLVIKYNNDGNYILDAEYIGLDTLLEILKVAELGTSSE